MRNKILEVIAVVLVVSTIVFILVKNNKNTNDLLQKQKNETAILNHKIDSSNKLIVVYKQRIDTSVKKELRYQDSIKVLKNNYVIINKKWNQKIQSVNSTDIDSVLCGISNYIK